MKSSEISVLISTEKKSEKKDKIETNVDIVQKQIDKLVPKEVSQMPEFTPDAIKCLLLRSEQLGGLITIVSKEGTGFLIKVNKEQLIILINAMEV